MKRIHGAATLGLCLLLGGALPAAANHHEKAPPGHAKHPEDPDHPGRHDGAEPDPDPAKSPGHPGHPGKHKGQEKEKKQKPE